jgi:hypothetical protein
MNETRLVCRKFFSLSLVCHGSKSLRTTGLYKLNLSHSLQNFFKLITLCRSRYTD